MIATIQRVYSVLTGKELSEEEEETSSFELRGPNRAARHLQSDDSDRELRSHRHRRMPPLDLWHVASGARILRRLHGRPHRDALVAHARFLQQEPRRQYPYERSVVDGVNVGFDIFRIRTEIGEHGGST